MFFIMVEKLNLCSGDMENSSTTIVIIHHYSLPISRITYRIARNKFKALYRLKRNKYRENLKHKLENTTSAAEFWKFVRANKNENKCVNSITGNEWKSYYSELFSPKSILDKQFFELVNSFVEEHDRRCEICVEQGNQDDVNRDVTLCEIDNVIDDLSQNKAPGQDGIGNEIIQKARVILTPMLHRLFNSILSTGIFPDEWCKAVIVPIYKKGNVNDPKNYRAVSLLPCISKIFTKIISNRLYKWANEAGKISEFQSGFVKGKSTIDNLYILQSLISKYLGKSKGRFYSVFVDFSNAFDSIPHQHLFYSLLNNQLHGRVINVLRNMYNKLKSCVQLQDFIQTDEGILQMGKNLKVRKMGSFGVLSTNNFQIHFYVHKY